MFDLKALARPELSIDAVNDGRHVLEDRPHMRESIPYLVNLPERQLAILVYTWVDKDSNAGAMLKIFGPGVGDDAIQLVLPDRPVAKDMNFDNWQIENFTLKQDLTFNRAEISWQGDDISVNYKFEAYHPPYAYGSHPGGCPPYLADERIEQSGTVKGTLVLRGEEIPLDTTGHRDHSWGTRDWNAMQHYKWFHGQAGDAVSVHFWEDHALGKSPTRGYVYKDGLMAEIKTMDLDDIDYSSELMPRRINVSITDEAGRVTVITGQFYSNYAVVPDPHFTLNGGVAAMEIDGKSGVGWLEVAWPKSYIDYIAASGVYLT